LKTFVDLCEVTDLRCLGVDVNDDENEANLTSNHNNSRRRNIRSLVHEVYVAQLEIAKREIPPEEMTREYREVLQSVQHGRYLLGRIKNYGEFHIQPSSAS
jgi:hypothetical protein